MSSEGRSGLNPQINEEAAHWFVEFRSGDIDASARREFDAWMRASPEHLRAFIEIAALWDHSAAADPLRRFTVESLVASASEADNVVRLATAANSGEGSRPGQGRPGGKMPAIRTMAVAAAFLVVVSVVAGSLLLGRDTYSTLVGEKRSLRLSDGSILTLNSRSKARIEFNNSTRAVALLEGEALFRVAKDPSRPFVVHTDSTFVRAVGTEFDIDRQSRATVVTVVEGRVAVLATAGASQESVPAAGAAAADGSPDGTVFLAAGEQLHVAGRSTAPTRTNVSSATAWTQGKVILQARTLEEVAEDFNRYSDRRLVTVDEGAVPLRLSGVFSTDPDFLIRYLRERPDIQVRETASEIRITRTGSR